MLNCFKITFAYSRNQSNTIIRITDMEKKNITKVPIILALLSKGLNLEISNVEMLLKATKHSEKLQINNSHLTGRELFPKHRL